MQKIFKQVLSSSSIEAMNRAIDNASDGDDFEILIPPVSTDILKEFKNDLLSQCPDIEWNDDSYVVIRTVTDKDTRAPQCWHFDNLRRTALIVLKSSVGPYNGDLLIRPNLRKDSKSLLVYIITKILWTNPITWMILRVPSVRNAFFTRVPLSAGDVMVFNGDTTYHGNLPVSSGTRRSILVHNDPLFKDSWITKLFHKLNKMYLYKT